MWKLKFLQRSLVSSAFEPTTMNTRRKCICFDEKLHTIVYSLYEFVYEIPVWYPVVWLYRIRSTEKWHITLWNLHRFFLWSNRKSKRELLFFFRREVYHDMNVEVCKYYLSPAWDIDRWWQQWSDFRSGKLRLSWVLRLKSWGLRASYSVTLSFNFDEAVNICKASNDAYNSGG